MICYRDMSFCDKPDCVKFNKCERAIKLRDIKEAEKAGIDICYSDFVECYEKRVK